MQVRIFQILRTIQTRLENFNSLKTMYKSERLVGANFDKQQKTSYSSDLLTPKALVILRPNETHHPSLQPGPGPSSFPLAMAAVWVHSPRPVT